MFKQRDIDSNTLLRFCLQLGLGTPGSLWGWALQESLGWALQGVSSAPKKVSGLGTPEKLWGWALQEHSRCLDSGVGHLRETLELGNSRHSVGPSSLAGRLWVGHVFVGVDRARRRVEFKI